MNRPRTVIRFINAAHVIDHMFMLIFPAAVLGMAAAYYSASPVVKGCRVGV